MGCFLGIDSGGTFTDFVLWRDGAISVHKVLSTPAAPEEAILTGISELGLNETMERGELVVLHGTTVATNAALERRGARTVFITNRGLQDLLFIGRQARQSLYTLTPEIENLPLEKEACLAVGARYDAKGSEVAPLTGEDLTALLADIKRLKPEAIAICLLFSFMNDEHEVRIKQAITDDPELASIPTYKSSEVLPVHREFERAMATWLNAYLAPKIRAYISNLQTQVTPSELWVMQSSGDLVSSEYAQDQAVNLLLSGPAGGLVSVQSLGQQLGREKLLSFDMGGTSTDVAVVHRHIFMRNEAQISGWPVSVPMVDMHTIGAGGGSIVKLDAAGVLQVGPESAGADPGPVCYGRATEQLTVTDANLMLGRIGVDFFKPDGRELDLPAVEKAFHALALQTSTSAEQAAEGVIAVANEKMAAALRYVALQKGLDVREHSLVCFGGAGGLHACALADLLNVNEIIVPHYSGVLSAMGMLVAKRGQQLSESLAGKHVTDVLVANCAEKLKARAMAQSDQYQEFSYFLDMRYRGQEATIAMSWQDNEPIADVQNRFSAMHDERYGHTFDLPVEVSVMRVHAAQSYEPLDWHQEVQDKDGAAESTQYRYPVHHRLDSVLADGVSGPAIIKDEVSTTWLAETWQAQRDSAGHLLLQKMT